MSDWAWVEGKTWFIGTLCWQNGFCFNLTFSAYRLKPLASFTAAQLGACQAGPPVVVLLSSVSFCTNHSTSLCGHDGFRFSFFAWDFSEVASISKYSNLLIACFFCDLLMNFWSNCNWYFPDDDDDERTHMVLGFRASSLHCPPQSAQSTAMGRDCATDSAQWCHLWFFAPELTVWIGCSSILSWQTTQTRFGLQFTPVRSLTASWHHFLTSCNLEPFCIQKDGAYIPNQDLILCVVALII